MSESIEPTRRCARCEAPLNRWSTGSVCWSCMLASDAGRGALTADAVASAGAAQPPTSEPMRFGDYLLEREIAHGGMGVVYQARQLSLGRRVAVKLLLLGRYSSGESIERFKREAQAAAALHHPSIVAIHDVGSHDGQHYFSMELVEGQSLAERLREGPLEPHRAAEIAEAVAGTIHYAHQQGVLHRDLKPSNVLIDALGQVRVTDFGLAKKLDGSSDLTVTGQMVGTPNYLSPEQAAGRNAELGPASDVYAIGALLYELLTGRPPFLAQSLQETLLRIRDADPVSLRALNPALPQDLETICLKCLQKEPARRYASAQALAEDLGRWLQQLPIKARPTGAAERAWLWCRRNPRQALLGAALTFALAGGVAGIFTEWRLAEGARERAEGLRASAELSRREAERQEMASRRSAYASDIGLAQRAIEENNLGRAKELLDRQRPPPGKTDLRGWEWRFLWQQCRSDALFSLARGQGAITGLSPSAEGQQLAVVSAAGTRLAVWDLPSRREVATVATAAGIKAAFSPAEPLLAFATAGEQGKAPDYAVHLWSPAQGREERSWKLPGQCRGLAFSEDGKRLVTVLREDRQELDLWNVADGSLVASNAVPLFADGVGTPFAASSDLHCVAIGISDHTILVIDPESGELISRIGTNDSIATAIALSPDSTLLAAGYHGADPCIQVYELPSGRPLRRIEGPFGYPVSLTFAKDGRSVLSANSDQTIRRWDMTSFRPAGVLRGHTYEVWRLALPPGGRQIISGSGHGELLVWDAAVIRHPRELCRVAEQSAFFWRFTPDGVGIIVGREDGKIIRRTGPEFQQSQTLLDVGPDPYDVGVSDDCRWVAASDRQGTIRVWNLQTTALQRELAAGTPMARIWGFADEGKRLLVIHRDDESLHEWDLDSGKYQEAPPSLAGWRIHGSFPQQFNSVSIGLKVSRRWTSSPNSSYPTNKLARFFTGAFTSDERLFARDAGGGRIQVESAASGEQLARARAVLQAIHSVAFSRDGQRLAVGGDNREAVKLWQLEGFQELLTLAAEGSIFSQTHFSPDGNRLGSMDNRGNLYIWSAPTWDEIAAAERGQTR